MRWEYKIVDMQRKRHDAETPPTMELEIDLNELGASEWELVGMIPQPPGGRDLIAILKRPCTDSRW